MNAEAQLTQAILTERRGAVFSVALNAPPKNPIGIATVDALEALLPTIAADRSVRAVILTGSGEEAFSVGANVKEFATGVTERGLRGFTEQRWRVIDMLAEMEKPVIAAVNGLCLGGGFEFAMGCHLRLAAVHAEFALPEINLGLVPAWSGTQRLPQLIGRAAALELMLRGGRMKAEEAHRLGAVNAVYPREQLLSAAWSLAEELASKAPLAVAGILCAVRAGAQSFEAGLEAEFRAVEQTGASADAAEGLTAFLEKRKPSFRGE